MKLTLALVTALVFLSPLKLKSEDLLIAVIEVNNLLTLDAIAPELHQLNLASLEGRETVNTGSGELRGAAITLFSRQPLLNGKVRTLTRLGVSSTELEYQYSNGGINLQLQFVEGREVPLRKVISRNFKGSAALSSGSASVAAIQASQNIQSSAARGNYKRDSAEKTRFLLVQKAP